MERKRLKEFKVVRLRLSGSSHAITLARRFTQALGWRLGDSLAVRAVNGSLVVTPVSLRELKAQ